jgi:tRNA (adenine22-N1)-methyltransferase
MILKGRLGLLFQMLPQGRCLLDVGTDHALIPAAAVQAGLFPRAVATDIRPGPLARAERTIHKHALEDRVTLLLGAGFAPVAPGLCDVLVLAGMGALMITGILEAHPEVAHRPPVCCSSPCTRRKGFDPGCGRTGMKSG